MRISDWSSDVCSSDVQALNERLGAALAGAGRDLERLGDKLADGAGTSTGKAHKVALTLARLGQANPSISALLSNSLVETASDGVIAAASREAAALLAERDAVVALIQPDALNADPAALEELSDTIESTGAVARPFSSR